MTRPLAQLNRFFVSPEFSVHYRKAKQLVWQNQATSGYSLLTTLSGKLDYAVDDQRFTLEQSESIVLDPNTSVTAKGQQVELLFLTFSPSLVIQNAAAMRLIPPKSIVSFTGEHMRGDRKVDGLLQEFAAELAPDKPGRGIVLRAPVA